MRYQRMTFQQYWDTITNARWSDLHSTGKKLVMADLVIWFAIGFTAGWLMQ